MKDFITGFTVVFLLGWILVGTIMYGCASSPDLTSTQSKPSTEDLDCDWMYQQRWHNTLNSTEKKGIQLENEQKINALEKKIIELERENKEMLQKILDAIDSYLNKNSGKN